MFSVLPRAERVRSTSSYAWKQRFQAGFTLLEILTVVALMSLLLASAATLLRPPSDEARLRDWLAQFEVWYVAVQDQALLGSRDLGVRQKGRSLQVWQIDGGEEKIYTSIKPLTLPAGIVSSWQSDDDGFVWRVSRYGLATRLQASLGSGETLLKVQGDELGNLSW